MTRSARIWFGSITSWRPIAPFAALFVLLILFALGGMLVIAREADRSDASRAREAVSRTFSGMELRLAAAVEMNAAAPPIAQAVAGPFATPTSIYGYLNFTSTDALGYYGTVVLNSDGSAFAGTRFGLPWVDSSLAATARLIAPVAARLPGTGARAVSALILNGSGNAYLVSVANVTPSDGKLGARSGTMSQPRRLAILAPVRAQVVPKMLPSLGVEGFRIGSPADNDNSVTVPVIHGPAIVFTWRPRTPGRAAIGRWAPAIGALLFTALVMLTLAGRSTRNAIRALEHLAHHDALTGLPNLLAFRDELDRRQACGETFALGMFDLNGFKTVNDEYGHLTGDEVLKVVAAEFIRAADPCDFIARLGGDEFAWISVSRTAANQLSENLTDCFARPLQVGQLSLRIGAAIGIALARAGLSTNVLMAQADARLYENKTASCAKNQATRRTENRERSVA